MKIFSRRAILMGLASTGAISAVSGCTGILYGRAAAPGPAYGGDGPYKLRIAMFESARIRTPIHAGMLIHAPAGHILYDPAGWWNDGKGQRVGDVTHGMTPEREADYLSRNAFGRDEGSWTLHLFEIEVTPEIATRAAELAQTRDMAVIGLCIHAVSRLLGAIPGFEDMPDCVLPSRFLLELQRRDDLTYTRHTV